MLSTLQNPKLFKTYFFLTFGEKLLKQCKTFVYAKYDS